MKCEFVMETLTSPKGSLGSLELSKQRAEFGEGDRRRKAVG